ncbi:MAG: hypothetical protein OXF39_00880 [Nitrospira sp.]|nr:hypothetical protein [Nitrospira sp.]
MSQAMTDEQVAERIHAQLGDQSGAVDDVLVKGDLLQLHVTEEFYRRLAVDRDRGRKIVLMLMQQMKSLTGRQDVTVRVYSKSEKMIESKVKAFGGDNVTYMLDL